MRWLRTGWCRVWLRGGAVVGVCVSTLASAYGPSSSSQNLARCHVPIGLIKLTHPSEFHLKEQFNDAWEEARMEARAERDRKALEKKTAQPKFGSGSIQTNDLDALPPGTPPGIYGDVRVDANGNRHFMPGNPLGGVQIQNGPQGGDVFQMSRRVALPPPPADGGQREFRLGSGPLALNAQQQERLGKVPGAIQAIFIWPDQSMHVLTSGGDPATGSATSQHLWISDADVGGIGEAQFDPSHVLVRLQQQSRENPDKLPRDSMMPLPGAFHPAIGTKFLDSEGGAAWVKDPTIMVK
jgi:hypothetical protein